MPAPTTAAPPRRIGRILSLGFPLPGPRVDNYTFLSAPSLFDYDAIVVDPRALSELVEAILSGAEQTTFVGAPIRNQRAEPRDVLLAEILQARSNEAKMFLANGGVFVLFARAITSHAGVDGMDQLDDLFWLEDPPVLTRAEGTAIDIVDYEHPLAAFLHGQAANLRYEATVEEAPAARVIARSHGGAVVAAELPRPHGQVVLLPPPRSMPSGQARYAMSDALQAGIRRMLGVMAEGNPPPWIAKHALPGLDDRAEALKQATTARDTAVIQFERASAAHEELARYRRLLWQEGALGLEDVVADGLKLIGFDVYPGTTGAASEARADGVPLLIEVEASDGAVDMAPHHRLRQRIEQRIEQRAGAPRGLILINAHRLQPPSERPQPVTDALLAASEAMGYRIATTASLFEAIVSHMRGDESAVTSYRAQLLAGRGLLRGPAVSTAS